MGLLVHRVPTPLYPPHPRPKPSTLSLKVAPKLSSLLSNKPTRQRWPTFPTFLQSTAMLCGRFKISRPSWKKLSFLKVSQPRNPRREADPWTLLLSGPQGGNPSEIRARVLETAAFFSGTRPRRNLSTRGKQISPKYRMTLTLNGSPGRSHNLNRSRRSCPQPDRANPLLQAATGAIVLSLTLLRVLSLPDRIFLSPSLFPPAC